MIKLKLQPIERITSPTRQVGIDQSIYRVLCILMIDDTSPFSKRGSPPLYTPTDVAKFGFDKDTLKEIYKHHVKRLSTWARSKGIHETSDNRDARGEKKSPHCWTREHWQERISDDMRNKAADIIDQAIALEKKEGVEGDTFWYSEAKGVYRVSEEDQQKNIARIKAIHSYLEEHSGDDPPATEAMAYQAVFTEQSALLSLWPKIFESQIIKMSLPLLLGLVLLLQVPAAKEVPSVDHTFQNMEYVYNRRLEQEPDSPMSGDGPEPQEKVVVSEIKSKVRALADRNYRLPAFLAVPSYDYSELEFPRSGEGDEVHFWANNALPPLVQPYYIEFIEQAH